MDYWHKGWVCPFFKWDDKLQVNCEGGSRLNFPNVETATEFMDKKCAAMGETGYQSCPVASALLRFYEKQEDK